MTRSSSEISELRMLYLRLTTSSLHLFPLPLSLLKSSLESEQSIKKPGVSHTDRPWMGQRLRKPWRILITTPVILNGFWGREPPDGVIKITDLPTGKCAYSTPNISLQRGELKGPRNSEDKQDKNPGFTWHLTHLPLNSESSQVY